MEDLYNSLPDMLYIDCTMTDDGNALMARLKTSSFLNGIISD